MNSTIQLPQPDRHIRIINEVSTQLLNVKDEHEIYQILYNAIKELLPDVFFLVSRIQEDDINFRIVKISGLDNYSKLLKVIIGKDPFTMNFPISDVRPEQISTFESRKLHHFENGIHDLANTLNKTACKVIEKILDICDVCAVSFCVEKKYFGAITFFISGDVCKNGLLTKEIELTIETFSNQASTLIEKLRNQAALKQKEKELIISKDNLKKFTTHLLKVTEEEKILLATQIDDELRQNLVAIKMDIGIYKKHAHENNDISNATFKQLEDIYNLLGESIDTTLKMTNELRYEVLYLMGFKEAVDLYSTEFQNNHGIDCKFECTISNLKMNEMQALFLFRILQEILNKIAQYAKATKVKIRLNEIDDKIKLEITNNGSGNVNILNSDSINNKLAFMKEKISLMNGELHTNTSKKSGNIRVEIPFDKSE